MNVANSFVRVYPNTKIDPSGKKRCFDTNDPPGCTDCDELPNYYKANDCDTDDEEECCRRDGIIDWGYSTENCVAGRLNQKCLRFADFNQSGVGYPFCGNFIGTPEFLPTGNWDSNDDSTNTPTQGRIGKCIYDMKIFLDENIGGGVFILKQWKKEFIDNLPNGEVKDRNIKTYNEVIMPQFCFRMADPKDCTNNFLPNPGETEACKGGLKGCSILNSTTESGKLCSDWRTEVGQGSTPFLTAMTKFCANEGQCSKDCLCTNRASVDPVYQSIREDEEGPQTFDMCWYAPCQNAPPYFIPKNQLPKPGSTNSKSTTTVGAPQCPTFICTQITNIVAGKGSSITNSDKNRISCNTSDNPNGPVVEDFNRFLPFIIGGLILVVVIILIICVFAFSGKSKNPQPGVKAK